MLKRNAPKARKRAREVMAPGQDDIMMAWYEDGIPSCFNIDSYPGACQDYTRAKLMCCFPLQEDVDAESQPLGNYL